MLRVQRAGQFEQIAQRWPHVSRMLLTAYSDRELLLDALKDPQSTRRLVAERLGISPRTLRYKLARLRAAGVSVPAA